MVDPGIQQYTISDGSRNVYVCLHPHSMIDPEISIRVFNECWHFPTFWKSNDWKLLDNIHVLIFSSWHSYRFQHPNSEHLSEDCRLVPEEEGVVGTLLLQEGLQWGLGNGATKRGHLHRPSPTRLNVTGSPLRGEKDGGTASSEWEICLFLYIKLAYQIC